MLFSWATRLLLTAYQYAFSRDFKKKGMIPLSTYLRQYKSVDLLMRDLIES